MLAIVCMIRTGAHYLPDFIGRVDRLADELDLRVIVGENDSRDDTKDLLAAWQRTAPYDVTVLDCGDGSEHFGSVENPDRWRSIAGVMNKVLDRVVFADDQVMYVDPDLHWEPWMILNLIERRAMIGADVLAPFTMYGGRAYDLWGTRRNGQRISRRDPYWPDVAPVGMVPVDSAACLNVLDGHWAMVARFTEADANVGWHDEMRAKGARIFLDFDTVVRHP